MSTNLYTGRLLGLIILLLIVGICIIVAVALGPAELTVERVFNIIIWKIPGLNQFISDPLATEGELAILFRVRLPRIIAALLVGAALSGAGVTFQGLFKNPMAGPYTIGLSSGAALGATIAIIAGLHQPIWYFYPLPLLAFAASLGTTLTVYNLAVVSGKVPVTTLLLAGIAVGSFLSAIQSFLMLHGKWQESLHVVVYWIMGSLAARNWSHVQMSLPYIIIGIAIIIFYSRDLNLILLGEETAQHLGVEVEKVKKILLIAATLTAAAAVSISGVIGFVGIVIPHVTRLLFGPDHRILVPASLLIGGIFMISADSFARTFLGPTELPVGIVTAFLGAPFFIYLLRRQKGGTYL